MRRALAALAALPLALVLTDPAAASNERMQLECQDGRVVERTNGSSWWGVDSQVGYVSEHLLITRDGDVVHQQSYGHKGNGERSTCVADHFGYVWTVDLVRTR